MKYNKPIHHGLKANNVILWVAEKANCTAICHMFFESIGLLDVALQYSSWIHDYRWNVYIKQNMTMLNDLKDEKFIRIKFVRSPYDRAVSSYLHVRKRNQSFLDFLKRLSGKDLERYGSIENPHVQTQYFREEKQFQWNEIIRVENYCDEVNRINEKYSLNLKCDHVSKHWRKNKSIPPSGIFVGDNARVSAKDINYIDFYNDQTRKLVEEIYSVDLANFGYTYEEFVEYNIPK